MWHLLHSKLLFLIDKYMPTKSLEPNSRPKWLNSKQKHKGNIFPQREILQLLLSNGQNLTLNLSLLIVLIKQNPSIFWKYARENTKVHRDIMSLRKEDGLLTCSDQETTQFLNDFFSSVFTTEPESDLP